MTLMERDDSSVALPRLLLLATELALLTLVIRFFYIGGRPFIGVSYLALAGFVVHALLPKRYRPAFFLALSVAGIVVVAGVRDGAWLLLVVVCFLAVSLLPMALRWRVLLLVTAGVVFAFLRLRGGGPWSEAVWPVIASMLMFRLIVFLYDIQHEKQRPSLVSSLSYFLLLPNVAFPLFPVADFKRYRSTYYSEPAKRIYARGLKWMVRGVYQLLLYRIVYQLFTVAPGEVGTTAELLRYILSSYGLYLRVSGLFHLIVGQLLLFGFNLPETHHRYFFASSFNDFWRRINIYWKDFMLKLFYYPAYFRLKRWGPTVALVGSTLVVFLLTWALHTYQWFWLRGTVLFAPQDVLFWGVLGVAVVFNSVWEMRRGRERVLGVVRPFSYRWLARSGRVLATFTTLAILWSMWSADSLYQWLSMWRAAGPSAAAIPAVIPLSLLVSVWAARRARSDATVRAPTVREPEPVAGAGRLTRRWPVLEPALALGILCVLVLAERAQVGGSLPERIDLIRRDRLNAHDARLQERGYYEHLINVNAGARAALIDAPRKPADWENFAQTDLIQERPDFLLADLRPGQDRTFLNARFQTNRWGMRDRDYTLARPPGTVRIAVLGASYVMGWGVSNGETFPDLLETALNENGRDPRYEVLNFAIAGLSPLDHLYLLDAKVGRFEPDVVIYIQQEELEEFVESRLAYVVRQGVEIPFPAVREVIDGLHLSQFAPVEANRALIAPHANRLVSWAERSMVSAIRSMTARPIAVYLPRTQGAPPADTVERLLHRSAQAGYDTINLRAVYDGYESEDLAVAEWDKHPNPLAHRLIAERLLIELQRRPELLSRPIEVVMDRRPPPGR